MTSSGVVARTPTFADVFRAHHDFVWRTLRHFGVSETSVDDATQDVFLVVHRRLADYDNKGSSMRSWLIGIARKVALRHRNREKKRIRRFELVDALEVRDEGQCGPHTGAMRVEAVSFVEVFVQSLPPKLRGVFQLCEIEGMTAPEVSAALGIPLNTVYSRLRLARRRFEAGVERRRHRERRETS